MVNQLYCKGPPILIVRAVQRPYEGQPYVTDSLLTKIKKYVIDIKQTPFQQDLVSAPASQAFVERMFSVWTAVIWPEKQSNHISGASVLLNINKKLLLDGSTPISLFLTHS
ncbi:hypothetical protein N1851_019258 [Merluccius polli]|uniref:Uncharacterized protein n=1 Tax=Merluccius polli TaxID=89951 RepID=A0AA47P0R7_MERPO|nr:hypothetical protein N1851_019258 [Merluccius polli]